MHRSALLAPAVSAALVLTLAPDALGQPQPPPGPSAPAPVIESAEQLRERARATLAAGDVAAACGLFAQAHEAAVKAAAAPGTPGVAPSEVLFDLAACHERQGRVDLAAAEYDQVAAAAGPQAEAAKARAAALRTPPPAPLAPVAPPAAQGAVPTAGAATLPAAEPVLPQGSQAPAPPTHLSDFMDTRLTWTLGDDDVLNATGETTPPSPNTNIGDRKQYRLFFDNLNSRFAGRENLTHLVLYKKMPGFIRHLDTEASLVLRFDIAALSRNTNNVNQSLYDSGSFIRLFYHTDGKDDGKTGLGLTLWALDTDRFRLGYLYDISWGGTNASINQSIFPRPIGITPGAKLQYDGERFSVFAGFKTATINERQQVLTPGTSEIEEIPLAQTNVGVLSGGAVDVSPYVHVDVGAGYFQQGRFEFPDVAGRRIFTYGASARVAVHDKESPIQQSVDFLLYRNDPNKPLVLFKPESYTPGRTTWTVSLEASNLFQNLKNFDSSGSTSIQPARSAALQGVIKTGYTRASVTGIYRDLSFVVRNQPGYIPFQTPPDDAETGDELFFAASVDHFFDQARLTPGISAGLQLPATFSTSSTDLSIAPINRTVVVREQGVISILPLNKSSVPIFQARASLKWDISPIMSAIGWLQYVRDNNGTRIERDPSEGTIALRTFVQPDFFGFGTAVQARF